MPTFPGIILKTRISSRPNLGSLWCKRELSNNSLKISVVFLLLFFSPIANTPLWACSFDVDCEVGSECIKNSGSFDGVCIGGLYPGNKNDRQPVYDPLDVNGTVGNTCYSSVDCGRGNYCATSSSAIAGVCLRTR
jgi:hypothetical protein